MRILAGILSVALGLGLIWYLAKDLVPPEKVVMAAGSEGGGYWRIAEQYRDILAEDGITLELVATGGSVDNQGLLAEGAVDVVLLQGGVDGPEGAEALGAVFFEPLFVFVRRDASFPANPGAWEGRRIAAGGAGSGTRAAVDDLLAATGLDTEQLELVPAGGQAGAEALLAGEVEAAIFVAPVEAPYLAPLFASGEVELLALEHLDALSRRIPQTDTVTLPAGSIRFLPAAPADDIRLLVMIARLAADADLHPGIVDRMVEAARRVHGGRDAITLEHQFPSTGQVDMPLDAYAGNLIANGTSSLQQYLPYWVVAQINRVAILAVPVLLLLLPLLRAAPSLYQGWMRSRVYRNYNEILEIDEAARASEDQGVLRGHLSRLDEIDRDIADLKMPASYRDYAYTARLHIDLVKKRIADRLT